MKTKHIFMSAEHNAGKSHKIKTANKNLSKYGTVTQTLGNETKKLKLCDEIKRTLNSTNASYHTAHNFWPSYLV